MPTHFFTVMVESIDVEKSFFQVFWVRANHLGEAIGKILKACDRLGIKDAVASEADDFDFNSLPDNVVHDKKLNVFTLPRAATSLPRSHSSRPSES